MTNRSEMDKAFLAEIRERKICFCAAAIDNKQCGPRLTTGFFFNLSGRPDSPVVTQAERGKFLDRPVGFQGFFLVNGKVDGVVEPGADLCIVGLVGCAWGAFQNVAIAGTALDRFERGLAGPEVLLLEKIFVAEARTERAIFPFIEGNCGEGGVSGVRD